MFIVGVVPDITEINPHQLAVGSSFENTAAKWALEHLRKQRQNIDLHFVRLFRSYFGSGVFRKMGSKYLLVPV
jgi:hypothetical protein